MSSRLDKAIKNFIQIIREAGNKGTSPLDAQAEVLRIDEDGTAWVHLPGGVDETPVKLTINAEVGDKVYVRLSGGRAWITGNQTAPPTDDKTAVVAKSLANIAGNRAKTAQKTADQAQVVANSALKGTKENAAQMAKMVVEFNGDIANLQDQIDGNISTWFYDVDPDMGLPPATDWDTNEKKDAHLGDIYYNTVKGYAWRFMKSGSTYSWERITDTDVTKALADAAKAQDTADSKRRIFYNTPTVPYDAGDLWVQGSGGDILRCAQAKTSTGSYDRNDWVLASKYTDDSALTTWIEGDFATTIQGLEEGLADAKIETYYQTTDPSTGWSDTQKSEHKGDLWYNSTESVQKYYRWSGTAWQELTATPPQAVFDNIDKKATIYTGTTTPTNPDSGDLWFKGADEPILTYVNNSWVEYNKYTDDSAVNNLEIGGRNYIVKKDSFSITKNGITVDYDGEVYHIHGTNTKTDANYSVGNFCQRANVFEPEAGYTISATTPLPSGLYLGINTLNLSGIAIPAGSNAYFYGNGSKTSNTFTCTQDTNGFLSGFLGVEADCGTVDVTFKIKLEKGNKATDWTPAPEDAQTGVDSLNDTVFGVQTFEYILDGVTIPAHKREDGTYYYILNDEEVTVAEANLVHDSDGNLVSYQDGGIYESLDNMSENIEAIGTKVNSFDARETAIYNAIQDNSLIARKNARVEGNSLIITNDTATEAIANLLNYLQLNADSIVIYGNGKDIVTIAKTADDSGYMKMNGTSMLQAQESRLSTIRLRSADGTGNLAFVAGSDGHVSLREVLD